MDTPTAEPHPDAPDLRAQQRAACDPADPAAQTLLMRLRQGDRRSIARAITAIENETETGRAIVRAIQPDIGRARVIGITGAPGAGKSTLASALIGELLHRGHRVGVVAVDPSSPFSGGAVLGDRVRMERHTLSERVFIRSLAARGHLGGLSRAVFKVVDVLDAAGFDAILVETVGAGQSEVEITELADTRLVVCPPGLGDDVQAIKAGILEIADILVVSKADLPGADRTEIDLRFMLSNRMASGQPAIMRVSAANATGIGELADAIDASPRGRETRRATGVRERTRRFLAQETGNLVRARLLAVDNAELNALIDAVARGEIDHAQALAQAARIAAGNWA